jgi:putative acetyltransferase
MRRFIIMRTIRSSVPDRCIRPETPRDLAEIRQVHLAAFGGTNEARIVDALRDAGALIVSLVATDEERVVGHIAFSPVTLLDGRMIGVGLAPVGVLPSHQKRGIGDALCREGLARARDNGARACVVLGHPAYYARFGFQHASTTWGLRWQGGHDDSFFAMELVDGALALVRQTNGVVRYHAAVA